MSDVLLTNNPNGGEIEIANGRVAMTDGYESAAYLSLWGGNDEDAGSDRDTSKSWWGNIGEPTESQHRSKTQHLLRSMPLAPRNIRTIEDAAKSDLAWLLQYGASDISVSASIPALNTLSLLVIIKASGNEYTYRFNRTQE